MELFDNIIEQYREVENTVAMMLMEIHKKITEMEKLKMNETEMKETMKENSDLHKGIYVPFAAYEIQEERHKEEKEKLMNRHDAEMDKVRKHYQKIVISVSSVLAIMIIGIFSLVFYFFNNYDFATVSQDGYGLNNFVNRSSSVEVSYGAEDNNDQLERPEQNTEGDLDK